MVWCWRLLQLCWVHQRTRCDDVECAVYVNIHCSSSTLLVRRMFLQHQTEVWDGECGGSVCCCQCRSSAVVALTEACFLYPHFCRALAASAMQQGTDRSGRTPRCYWMM